MPAPAVLFIAPPSFADDTDLVDSARDSWDDHRPAPSRALPAQRTTSTTSQTLPMTRGAREAATGMGISDADIHRCLDEPADVSPEPNHPGRSRFTRGNLTVIAGADGMVLRVNRTGGPKRSGRRGR